MIVFAMTAQVSILAALPEYDDPWPSLDGGLLHHQSDHVQEHAKPQSGPPPEPKRYSPRNWPFNEEAGVALFMPVLVLGGIYGGVFTPTEAAGMSAVYAVAVGLLLYKTMSFSSLCQNIKGLYDHIRRGHDPPLFYPDDQPNPGFLSGPSAVNAACPWRHNEQVSRAPHDKHHSSHHGHAR